MSQNLSAKDKVVLDKAPPKDGPAGKIELDPTDSESVVEHFSRMNPGDTVSGKFKATLDENGEKAITLSITEIEIVPDDEPEPAKDDKDEDESAEDEPAAVKVIKNDQGVPEQEGNNPPEVAS